MAYTKFHDPWHSADSATGGGDETTPVTAAAMDWIEAGIATAQATAESAQGDITTDPAWAAKGDLIVGTGADAAAIKTYPAASDYVLVSDTAQSTGLAYSRLTNAMVDAAAAIARSKLAVETRRIPIHLHTPRSATLAGNSFWGVVAQTNYDMGHWEFVKDVEGHVYGQVLVPAAIAATANAKIILAIVANATSGVTRLEVRSKNVDKGDGSSEDSVNPTFTAETAQDITVPGTAYWRKDVSFTLTWQPNANDLLLVTVAHRGDHANDTLAVNTLLMGAWLELDVN